jgi:hypothetical protein
MDSNGFILPGGEGFKTKAICGGEFKGLDEITLF